MLDGLVDGLVRLDRLGSVDGLVRLDRLGSAPGLKGILFFTWGEDKPWGGALAARTDATVQIEFFFIQIFIIDLVKPRINSL